MKRHGKMIISETFLMPSNGVDIIREWLHAGDEKSFDALSERCESICRDKVATALDAAHARSNLKKLNPTPITYLKPITYE